MMMGGPGGPGRLLNQETQKPRRVGATLARFWRYFRPWWYAVALTVALIVVATTLQVATAPVIGQAIDCYLAPNRAACWFDPSAVSLDAQARLAGLGRLVVILALLFTAGSLLQGLAFFTLNWAGQRALRQIREDTFDQIHRLSLGFYTRNEAGNIMSRITNDTDTIQQTLGFALLSVVSGVLQLTITGALMLQTNVPYALLSLSVLPLMAWATFYFSQQARRAFRRSRQEMGSVNAGLQESIAGVREVQAFSREEESIEQFRRANAANRDANVRAASFTSALNPVLEALGYVAIAIVVVVGGLSALRNQPLLGTTVISLGTVFAFIQYVQRFNQPIQQIAVLWTNIQSAIAGGERIFGLLDEVPEIVDRPDAQPLPSITGRVAFEEVWAEYRPGEPVLKGVSFVAEPGQTVAIVGPTGAGKTTIINLIPRFYDVSRGRVTIDGHDVREVTAASLRSQIGIVLQDTFLFSDTVMNNIRYGRLDATDEEVIAAAKLAMAHDFIARLPEGYQTRLGERGAGLSQGQRQLIAIARAVLANPRILILDEATSSVDTRTERLIQRAFDTLLEGRTSFVIAHRLSTIRNADQVLMVQGGRIVERGTHEELLALRGAYYALYTSQFRREEELAA
ncbi:MAG: ABC transporter ATP-binding protein/permease [Chloroflexaceae bacterium]|nr:ABC transporter ATP-binding protein/permease [Chloroflexaceae bacterium]